MSVSLMQGDDFSTKIKPVLQQNCLACHNPANSRSRIDFLKAETASDLEKKRLLWRDVAIQLRNRTMPPGVAAAKLSEEDRLRVGTWIEDRLRETACSTGEFAGNVPPRRLNRREYHNTIRDLFGIDINVGDLFPADESGGAGFDTNGETLYIPPMMLERYMEAAQKILDRVVYTPYFSKLMPGHKLKINEEMSFETEVFVPGQYNLKVSIDRPKDRPVDVAVMVDGILGSQLHYPRDSDGGATTRIHIANLDRGTHRFTIVNQDHPVNFYSLTVEQKPEPPSAEKLALHHRLFGIEAGEAPIDPHGFARRLLAGFLAKAYRGPVEKSEVDRFYAIFNRAAERGGPYEESLKLALKGVLVSPRFLFRAEERANAKGMHPVSQYDMASRLSYFLWSTMPDEELLHLAAQNKLQDPAVLAEQVDRMIDHPRSRAFANAFVGQWLGTNEVGGRVVPLLTELQQYYTPEVAAQLREEPVMFFQHILNGGRSLLEILNGNYTFMTARLAKFYQVEDKVKTPLTDSFQRVEWPDERRAGVLGMASVLAMTSHYKMGSPVLRGAWVLDSLLGTPVPPPPPNIPTLEEAAKSEKGLSMRQILANHRANAACSSCHNLMDPIGYSLENFDWMGRWRDTETNGKALDVTGSLPSGEKFNGPVELRQVLVQRKEEFLRHVTNKMLGFALGRSLQDGDQCTVQRLVDHLEKQNYNARVLVREIVLSTPFRNYDDVLVPTVTAAPKREKPKLLGTK
ncbi:DUF1592 domain-containing protein [Bryobacter aggregatus]|uniref:DUF1592 domain-containing protein n=1 Tax=Bryobacter aggregatus TaxID=360054 RepID=UPI001EE309D9|nr:DUF1592 domain-containing protein [Bryobacter aggregatus]